MYHVTTNFVQNTVLNETSKSAVGVRIYACFQRVLLPISNKIRTQNLFIPHKNIMYKY